MTAGTEHVCIDGETILIFKSPEQVNSVLKFSCLRKWMNSSAYFQAQFLQRRPIGMASLVAPRMPMYPTGGPGVGQQIFYGQTQPALLPPQVQVLSSRFDSDSSGTLFYILYCGSPNFINLQSATSASRAQYSSSKSEEHPIRRALECFHQEQLCASPEWKFSDKAGARRETVWLDTIHASLTKYHDVDIIIFNTGYWWTHQKTHKVNNYSQEGNHVYHKFEVANAYTKAFKTWPHWVDTTINSNRTRVFFTGYSAFHFKGGQWNSGENGDGETKPIKNKVQVLSLSRNSDLRVLSSTFVQLGSKDPQMYLDKVKKIIQIMHVTEEESVELVSSRLKDVAYDWVEIWRKSIGEDVAPMTWQLF
ncbi:Protein trichome birefringence-like 4 [Capsicum chinense]|nr:Protein trichome birefringence-like 4 [Capsicum chinense]